MDIKATIQQLDWLKDKYRERAVSLLVGAGFSKNACADFPSWTELLYDMAEELYADELSQSYNQYRLSHPAVCESFISFKQRTIPSLIARKGYLPMVSAFIERKGFREAIECYIEERIPYIDEASHTFRYMGKNSGISSPIIKESFSAHQKIFDGEWEQIYTTNYDRLLEYAFKIDGREGLDNLVIKDAPQLSVGRGPRTIIKLHGDLQHPEEERAFAFDGNPHQQYIISKEDYQDYPRQHEAFTQLMRISLLQGVFCLVGFSGDDPNFQAWLSWVRDILARSREKRGCKIFLVDRASNLAPEDKQMFYDNHNICYIPLEHPEIKQHIRSSSTGFRELLVDFFDFLYRRKEDDNNPDDMKRHEQSPSYSRLWRSLVSDFYGGTKNNAGKPYEDHERTASAIIKDKPNNRLVWPTHSQGDFLGKITSYTSLTPSDAILSLFALQETGLPVDSFDGLENKLEYAIPEAYRRQWIGYIERIKLLSAKSLTSFSGLLSSYERCLHALFSLDFRRAQSILISWSPIGTDILKKAYLLSLFDVETSKQILKDFIDSSFDAKERFYATRLLNILENYLAPIHPTSFYTSTGVTDYWKIVDSMFRDLSHKRDIIHPHGEGFNIKIINMDGEPRSVDYPKAMVILNFLLEAPLSISYGNFFGLRSSADWYRVHLEIFERHPFAALYFSLQCTDKKVKTRIGQDYAYSDVLANDSLPEILEKLLNAYLSEDTPSFLKSSIILIAEEIIIAVKPSKWEDLFMRVWKEAVITNFSRLEDSSFSELRSFVFQALDCMQSITMREEIVADILGNGEKNDYVAINSLYCIRKEGLNVENEKLAQAVDEFVSSISKPWQIAVAGNVYFLLNSKQKKTIKRRISKMLDMEEFDDVSYSSSLHFISTSSSLEAALKEKLTRSISKNPLLWQTGISSDGHASSGAQFLHLSTYSVLSFSDATTITIYKKLKDSLSLIQSCHVFDSRFYHLMPLEDVLLEMQTFLHQHRDSLDKQSDFVEVNNLVAQFYKRTLDYHSVEDGLLSKYDVELESALKFLYRNRHEMERIRMIKLVNLVLHRLLMMNSDGLDKCLRYVRFLLEDGSLTQDDQEQMEVLVMILNRVTPDKLNTCNLNLAHATNNLSSIAQQLLQKGYDSSGIRFWQEYPNRNRYYSSYI